MVSTKPKDIFADHLSVLRFYAKKYLLDGEKLSLQEDADRLARLQKFAAIGLAYQCTYKDLVTLLYVEVFQKKRGCDCYSCKRRRMLVFVRSSSV